LLAWNYFNIELDVARGAEVEHHWGFSEVVEMLLIVYVDSVKAGARRAIFPTPLAIRWSVVWTCDRSRWTVALGSFQASQGAAKLPRVVPYDLRRSFVSMPLSNNVPLGYIPKLYASALNKNNHELKSEIHDGAPHHGSWYVMVF
jgi:hypothetical protein